MCERNKILLFILFFPDFNVDVLVTHKDNVTGILRNEKFTLPIYQKKSPLNDSTSRSALVFEFTDMIKIDLYLDIITSNPFSVFLAVEKTYGCENFEMLMQVQCVVNCLFEACEFENTELENDYRHPNVRYCRYKCQPTTRVLVRRIKSATTAFLPSPLKIFELAAMAI